MSHEPASNRLTPALLIAGIALLLVAAVASGMLVFQHIAGANLPGCGEGSPCAEAAASIWGSVPLVNWPTAYVGFAFFIGLLIAWSAAGGTALRAATSYGSESGATILGHLPWVVRIGAAASLGFIVIMFANISEYLCWYCMAAHLGNLGFLGIVEFVGRGRPRQQPTAAGGGALSRALRPVAHVALAFLAVTIILASYDGYARQQAALAAEEELEAAARRMLRTSAQPDAFTGRYLFGPERAPIRLVVITNYQCPECRRIEGEIMQILDDRDDVSLSVMHYPMSTDCNPYMQRNMHPHSCRAAQAAEAAGIVAGPEAFWAMHEWLFERSAEFTDLDLAHALADFGINPGRFRAAMSGAQVREHIHRDIEIARQIGLRGTPTIFINGEELRGWSAPDAIRRTIERLAERNPEPAEAGADRPPSAFEKHIDDWRFSPRREITPPPDARVMGPADAAVRIDLWGDFQHPGTAATDALIRHLLAQRDDVRYAFRHFPAQPECNPRVAAAMTPSGCLAAYAAEAAAQIAGTEGYRKLHEALMGASGVLDESALRGIARAAGLDDGRLLPLIDSAEMREAVQRDVQEAEQLGARGIPMMFINEQQLPRWDLEGHDVLGTVVEEAARR